MEKNQQHTFERAISIRHSGRWPPDLSSLAGTGFDSISVSRFGAVLFKAHSHDLSGKPHLYTEIKLQKDRVLLRYSCPRGFDERVRRLHATAFLLRALCLVPKTEASVSSFSQAVLPALEEAERISSEPYELLSKRCTDMEAEAFDLSSKNARLARASEETAGYSLGLEGRIASQEERLRKLQSVPSEALQEMLLDWLASHGGAFNSAQFSRLWGVPPSLAEEGLGALLQQGVIRKVSNGYARAQPPRGRLFELNGSGVGKPLEALARQALFAAKSVAQRKK